MPLFGWQFGHDRQESNTSHTSTPCVGSKCA